MIYRAANPAVSTRDWIALSLDAIPTALLTRGGDDDGLVSIEPPPSEPEWHVRPPRDGHSEHGLTVWCQPDRGDYVEGDDEAYDADCAAWEAYEEACREYDPAPVPPAWGTMWAPCEWDEDGHDLVRACRESGVRVYEHPIAGVLLGIDGGGYSFFAAHWIPLRARLVARNRWVASDDKADALRALWAEARNEGEGWRVEEIARSVGIALDAPAAEGAEVAQ